MHLRYELRAQWVPTEEDDWANHMLKISKLRTKKSVFLSRVPHEFPENKISRELKTEIGGMLGLGT